MNQLLFAIDGEPEPAPHVAAIIAKPQPGPPAEDAPRLAGNRLKVIERLRQGPATNVELSQVGGLRFGARIHELVEEGYEIEHSRRDGGVFVYELISEPTR